MIPRTSNMVFANAAAVFLASKDSSFITGIELSVDGGFTPVLAKHTKETLTWWATLSVCVDRIQRNFEPMQRQVESWRQTQITDAQAKLIF